MESIVKTFHSLYKTISASSAGRSIGSLVNKETISALYHLVMANRVTSTGVACLLGGGIATGRLMWIKSSNKQCKEVTDKELKVIDSLISLLKDITLEAPLALPAPQLQENSSTPPALKKDSQDETITQKPTANPATTPDSNSDLSSDPGRGAATDHSPQSASPSSSPNSKEHSVKTKPLSTKEDLVEIGILLKELASNVAPPPEQKRSELVSALEQTKSSISPGNKDIGSRDTLRDSLNAAAISEPLRKLKSTKFNSLTLAPIFAAHKECIDPLAKEQEEIHQALVTSASGIIFKNQVLQKAQAHLTSAKKFCEGVTKKRPNEVLKTYAQISLELTNVAESLNLATEELRSWPSQRKEVEEISILITRTQLRFSDNSPSLAVIKDNLTILSRMLAKLSTIPSLISLTKKMLKDALSLLGAITDHHRSLTNQDDVIDELAKCTEQVTGLKKIFKKVPNDKEHNSAKWNYIKRCCQRLEELLSKLDAQSRKVGIDYYSIPTIKLVYDQLTGNDNNKQDSQVTIIYSYLDTLRRTDTVQKTDSDRLDALRTALVTAKEKLEKRARDADSLYQAATRLSILKPVWAGFACLGIALAGRYIGPYYQITLL